MEVNDVDRNDDENVDVDVDYDNDRVPATKLGTNSDHSVYTHFRVGGKGSPHPFRAGRLIYCLCENYYK